MSKLLTTEVGTIIFVADMGHATKEYVCTSLTLSMRLNTLPTASVVIGCGSPLRGASGITDNSAEAILAYVANSSTDGSNFINCAIYEVLGEERSCIFKGCIVAASLVYKAGNVTMRAVRLECMNAACKLYCQPFTVYTNRCASDIVDRILATVGKTETDVPGIVKQGMERISSLSPAILCSKLNQYIDNKDIATKLSYITDAMALFTTHVVNETDPLQAGYLGTIFRINDYIKSNYLLDYKSLSINNQTDSDYNLALCERFKGSLQAGSILDTIIGTAVSTDYMLTLAPTWEADNFMMELRPSMAWNSKNSWSIHFSDISEVNSSYNPLGHINDPEVFVVDFSPATEFHGRNGNAGNPASSLIGTFSTNPQVAEWAAIRFGDSTIELPKRAELTKNMMRFKWREIAAPTWLRNSIVRASSITNPGASTQPANIKDRRTWDKEDDPKNVELPLVRDYNAGQNIADLIAKALYVHLHGATATAQIDLLPYLRFGRSGVILEEHIGELINILPTTKEDQQLAIRGMLEGLQFEYTAGQSANCRYTMMLSRVRPYDEHEQAIECPLYVRTSAK